MFLCKAPVVASLVTLVVLLASWLLAVRVHTSQRGELQPLSALGLPGSRAAPFERLRRRSTLESHTNADVTAILLNWNRLESLVRVVEHLCQYDYIFATVVVWNNNQDIALTDQVRLMRCVTVRMS
jgi:hypothetical protein